MSDLPSGPELANDADASSAKNMPEAIGVFAERMVVRPAPVAVRSLGGDPEA